jgi:hypothetical protein
LADPSKGGRADWPGDYWRQFDYTFLTGEWRIGQALVREEEEGLEAAGTRGQLAGSSGGNFRVTPETRNDVATIAEKVERPAKPSVYA